MESGHQNIPVCKPLMPKAADLLYYLDRVDISRHYTNFGPLALELEARLSSIVGVPNSFVTASSGTLALSLAIQAMSLAPNSMIWMPAFTFIGTAAAIKAAGHSPYLCDVDFETWALTPRIAKDAFQSLPVTPAAIVVVAPFGAMPNISEWESFQSETGVKVIIDAAAADVTKISPSAHIPIMTSLHATKLVGAGEGGVVCSKNARLLGRIRELSNFGLSDNGVSQLGTNAKMSEYHAAVALASLDNWSQTRALLEVRNRRYVDNLSSIKSLVLAPSLKRNDVSITCVVFSTVNLEACMRNLQVETRKWWRLGCHKEPAFTKQPGSFPITDCLAAGYLGLPMHIDLSLELIDLICQTIDSEVSAHNAC